MCTKTGQLHPLPRLLANETDNAVTSLGGLPALSRNEEFLSTFQPRDSFSGVLDETTGEFLAYESIDWITQGIAREDLVGNQVPRNGGHPIVDRSLEQAV